MKITAENIHVFLSKCKENNWAGVFFSQPFQEDFQFWLQDLHQPVKPSDVSFVFSPFDATFFPSINLHPTVINADAVKYLEPSNAIYAYWDNPHLEQVKSTSENDYHQQFQQYIANIQSGVCSKAILSTITHGALPKELNIGDYVFELRKKYPQAFVYVFSSPFAGTWIGATPETLLKWQDDEISTMSLAGTKKTKDTQFNFGTKEENEQAIVTDYIAAIFNHRLKEVEVMEREELNYGEMTHLLSRVKGKAGHSFTREQLLELANELHPTPAVGGFPLASAIQLIHSVETHPRSYYSGFLGIVGQNHAELAVNLRCMCLSNGQYYAFAGGGITADSRADSEWAETRLKVNALLKFL